MIDQMGASKSTFGVTSDRFRSNRLSSRGIPGFVVLKVKDFQDAVKDLNSNTEVQSPRSQSRPKARQRARTTEGGSRNMHHRTQQIVARQQVLEVEEVPTKRETVPKRVEENRALWQMQFKQYDGVFSMDLPKQQPDFFKRFERVKRQSENLPQRNEAGHAKYISYKTKQRQRKIKLDKQINKKNEELVAVFNVQPPKEIIFEQRLMQSPTRQSDQDTDIIETARTRNMSSTMKMPLTPGNENLTPEETFSYIKKPSVRPSTQSHRRQVDQQGIHLLIRRKQQSNHQVNTEHSVIFKKGDTETSKTAASAKLMSISSDLKKNILPGMHNRINSIYRKRLTKYLNLVSIHGDRNQQLINSIYNGRRIEEEQLRNLQIEIATMRLKQIQNNDLTGVLQSPKSDSEQKQEKFVVQPQHLSLHEGENVTTMMGFKDSQHSVTYKSVTPVEASTNPHVSQPDRKLSPNREAPIVIRETERPHTVKRTRPPMNMKRLPTEPIERIKFLAGIKPAKPDSPIRPPPPVAQRRPDPIVELTESLQEESYISQFFKAPGIQLKPWTVKQSIAKEKSPSSSMESLSLQKLTLEKELLQFERMPIRILSINDDVSDNQQNTETNASPQLRAKNHFENSKMSRQMLSNKNTESIVSPVSDIRTSNDIQHLLSKPLVSFEVQPQQQKKVKMYEFHLPVHTVREEGSIDKSQQQRLKLSPGRAKGSLDKKPKDDVSSQMIDATTYRDLQNSQPHFNEQDYLTKYTSKSQIGKHPRRSEKLFKSQTSINESRMKAYEETQKHHLNSVQHDVATLIDQPSLENQLVLGLPQKLTDTNQTQYLLSEKTPINKGEMILVSPGVVDLNATPNFFQPSQPELYKILAGQESSRSNQTPVLGPKLEIIFLKEADPVATTPQRPFQQKVQLQMTQHQIGLKKTKSTSPARSTKPRINSQFKQPSFRQAQKFTGNMIIGSKATEQIKGKLRAFKANGELYFQFEQQESTTKLELKDVLKELDLEKLVDNAIINLPLEDKRYSMADTLHRSPEESKERVTSAKVIPDLSGQKAVLTGNNWLNLRSSQQMEGRKRDGGAQIDSDIEAIPSVVPLTARSQNSSDAGANIQITQNEIYYRTYDSQERNTSSLSRRVISLHQQSRKNQNTSEAIRISINNSSPKAVYHNTDDLDDDDIASPTGTIKPLESFVKIDYQQAKVQQDKSMMSETRNGQDQGITHVDSQTIQLNETANTPFDRSKFQLNREEQSKLHDSKPSVRVEHKNKKEQQQKPDEKTILKNMKKKRTIKIENSILTPRLPLKPAGNSIIKLMSPDVTQLIDAFFRKSGQQQPQQIVEEIQMFDKEQPKERNRRIQSQQNARGRRIIQGLTFQPVKAESNQVIVSPVTSLGQWACVFGNKKLPSTGKSSVNLNDGIKQALHSQSSQEKWALMQPNHQVSGQHEMFLDLNALNQKRLNTAQQHSRKDDHRSQSPRGRKTSPNTRDHSAAMKQRQAEPSYTRITSKGDSALEHIMQRVGNINVKNLDRSATGRIDTDRIVDNMRQLKMSLNSPLSDPDQIAVTGSPVKPANRFGALLTSAELKASKTLDKPSILNIVNQEIKVIDNQTIPDMSHSEDDHEIHKPTFI